MLMRYGNVLLILLCHLLKELPRTIECPIEPAYIAVSSTYLAVGMNNRVWFTDISSENGKREG